MGEERQLPARPNFDRPCGLVGRLGARQAIHEAKPSGGLHTPADIAVELERVTRLPQQEP